MKNTTRSARSGIGICLAVVFFSLSFESYSNEDEVVFLDQGWDMATREKFYYTPQGSRLMPYKWFMALESASGDRLFSDPTELQKYGWIYHNLNSGSDSRQLPIGFSEGVIEMPDYGKWVGMTCSACHTSEITFQGKRIRIDGAPAQADFGYFISDLSEAVSETMLEPEKFALFAQRVLGNEFSEAGVKRLRELYANFASKFIGETTLRKSALAAGPARVDALGQIINSLSVFFLEQYDNYREAAAPVSFPFLWYTPRLEWVQWNPIASNPITRNVGEVLGVFGIANFESPQQKTAILDIEKTISFKSIFQDRSYFGGIDLYVSKSDDVPLNSATNPQLFQSSALLHQLHELETWVKLLKPPVWDEKIFGKVDRKQAKMGKILFDKDCADCHNMPPFSMTSPDNNIIGKQFIRVSKIGYKDVNTDPAYTESVARRVSRTGKLRSVLFDDEAVVPAATFFLKSVGAIFEKSFTDAGLTQAQIMEYSDYRFYKRASADEKLKPYSPDSIDTLKAGPLVGIWATGPYLHNGSVKSIYDLLSPASERLKNFDVGGVELDTKNLGFVSGSHTNAFNLNTELIGNQNRGHEYPAIPYEHDQKMAIIEYLKIPSFAEDE